MAWKLVYQNIRIITITLSIIPRISSLKGWMFWWCNKYWSWSSSSKNLGSLIPSILIWCLWWSLAFFGHPFSYQWWLSLPCLEILIDFVITLVLPFFVRDLFLSNILPLFSLRAFLKATLSELILLPYFDKNSWEAPLNLDFLFSSFRASCSSSYSFTFLLWSLVFCLAYFSLVIFSDYLDDWITF